MTPQALTSRAYCLRCETPTTFYGAGVENGDRPRVEHWRCSVCGHTRMQLADVTDAEQLCRSILDAQLRKTGAEVDYGDALSLLRMELWDLFLAWDPTRGVRFTAYATGLLRLRVNNWWRGALGRGGSKAHAGALSLDAEPSQGGAGLAESVAAVENDLAMDRSADLHGAVSQGDRGAPEHRQAGPGQLAAASGRQRGLGVEPHARTAA